MTTLSINISESTKRFPIYMQYDGQSQHQPCGLELDLKTGELTDFYSGEIGNAVPMSVWHGTVLRFTVDPYIMRDGLIALAEEYSERFQMILDTSEAEWDDSNWVGHLSPEAKNFIEQWDQRGYGKDGQYNVTLISVEDQMQYEQLPATKVDLDALVKNLLDYDGDAGYYETEPNYHDIESDVLDYMIERVLFGGDDLAPEIAQLILEQGKEVGAWQEELEAFATQNNIPA